MKTDFNAEVAMGRAEDAEKTPFAALAKTLATIAEF